MGTYGWVGEYRRIYDKAVELYRHGKRVPAEFFTPEEQKFLAAIGQTPMEVYDFAEDWVADGEPDFGTALLIVSARRDYFLVEQAGHPSAVHRAAEEFPRKTETIEGIEWLARIIEKARAKLRGELPPELMYGCGGDRAFLKKVDVHPADFLRVVWSAHQETAKIVAFVKDRQR
jgi:hypothetical protein